jgi:DNA-binding winged helix-turn-helix (wHTH) protein
LIARTNRDLENAVELRFEGFAVGTDRREIHCGGDLVVAGALVFDLLVYLICNRDRVVSKDDLANSLWVGRAVSDSTLTTHIHAARQVIGNSGDEQRLIRTLQRKGFRFVGSVRDDNLLPAPGLYASSPTLPSLASAGPALNRGSAFTNMSEDPAREYFADGVTEDIITELSRLALAVRDPRETRLHLEGARDRVSHAPDEAKALAL